MRAVSMPHRNSGGGGDDLASTDEVKVYKDEGDDENRASENLSEDKQGLVLETEEVSVVICNFFCVCASHISNRTQVCIYHQLSISYGSALWQGLVCFGCVWGLVPRPLSQSLFTLD